VCLVDVFVGRFGLLYVRDLVEWVWARCFGVWFGRGEGWFCCSRMHNGSGMIVEVSTEGKERLRSEFEIFGLHIEMVGDVEAGRREGQVRPRLQCQYLATEKTKEKPRYLLRNFDSSYSYELTRCDLVLRFRTSLYPVSP
jgi:hypothetical protein